MGIPLPLLMILAITSGMIANAADIHIILVTSSSLTYEPGAAVAYEHIKRNSTLLNGHNIKLYYINVSNK